MKRGWMPMEKEQTLLLETGENQQAMKPLRVVVVGKSGSGKSSLCNQLARNHQYVSPTGQNLEQSLPDVFPVGHGLKTVTTRCQEVTIGGLTIVDTSDNIDEIVRTQKPHIYDEDCRVLLVLCIRCDARFAAEEYNVYKELKDAWGDDADFCRRLVVAFTYGDKLDSEESLDEKLKVTWPQLQKVLQDAGRLYVLFHDKTGTDDPEAVKELSTKIKDMELNHVVRRPLIMLLTFIKEWLQYLLLTFIKLLTVTKEWLQYLLLTVIKEHPKEAVVSVALVFGFGLIWVIFSTVKFEPNADITTAFAVAVVLVGSGSVFVVIFLIMIMVTDEDFRNTTLATTHVNVQRVFYSKRPADVY